MLNKDEVIVHVQADKWIPGDHVWVTVPYKLWGHSKLAAGLAKAVEMTFAEDKVSDQITGCKECSTLTAPNILDDGEAYKERDKLRAENEKLRKGIEQIRIYARDEEIEMECKSLLGKPQSVQE
jgi:hypothetical protein